MLTSSRKQYGTPLKKVEAYLEKLFAGPEKKPRKPRGGGKKKGNGKNKPDELKGSGNSSKSVHGA